LEQKLKSDFDLNPKVNKNVMRIKNIERTRKEQYDVCDVYVMPFMLSSFEIFNYFTIVFFELNLNLLSINSNLCRAVFIDRRRVKNFINAFKCFY